MDVVHQGTANNRIYREEQKEWRSVIGQFGLEFYSAFMVAVSVVVTSRKVGQSDEKGLKWTWNRGNSYELADESGLPTRTRVVIHLKPGVSAQFCKTNRVKDVVDTYSYFVAAPILLIGERVNSLNPIWTLQPKDVTKEMHEVFLKQLAKQQNRPQFQKPCYRIHYKVHSIIISFPALSHQRIAEILSKLIYEFELIKSKVVPVK